ncbi:Kinesin-like protein KIF2 [Giardia duodenalis]|uniref:Kinesin-like protein KIF2 n=1 Tax=Giardia intestinalis TaxID=5741 RepID=V6U2Z1_GIAIN|nr:Kinesin-like protein KIF2 [Giardia intestinalis]
MPVFRHIQSMYDRIEGFAGPQVGFCSINEYVTELVKLIATTIFFC